jgi:hypothetical protein
LDNAAKQSPADHPKDIVGHRLAKMQIWHGLDEIFEEFFFSGGLKWHAVTSRALLTLIGEQAKLSADAYVRFKNKDVQGKDCRAVCEAP